MALDEKDLGAIQLLIRKENSAFEERIDVRFDEVLNTLVSVIGNDEKLEQESKIPDKL